MPGQSSKDFIRHLTNDTTVVCFAEGQDRSEIFNAFSTLFDEHEDTLKGLAVTYHPAHVLHIPREFLYFIWNLNRWHHSIASWHHPIASIPWLSQAPRFILDDSFSDSSHTLFGPKTRKEIISWFAHDNDETARLLNLPKLFCSSGVEAEWEPFSGLTPECVFELSRRLDHDFALELLQELRWAPTRYLNRDMRLIRQGLMDATEKLGSLALEIPPHSEPDVSVLTSTYNHADYIEECIKGVIAQQTNYTVQHIIADDGSDDGTQDIILQYASRYPHIVPIFQKRRTWGIENTQDLFCMAQSEFVALCDGDDYFTDPHKIQIQVDFLKQHKNCALCFHPIRALYEGQPGNERLFPPPGELPNGVRPFYCLSDLIQFNFIQTNSVMYRWRFSNGLPDWFRTDLAMADWFWHLLHAEQGKIGFINRVMGVYRRHGGSLFALAETDHLEHRYKAGRYELKIYRVINDHFGGKFAPLLQNLANGVLADIVMYISKNENADKGVLEELADAYPEFVSHFFASLQPSGESSRNTRSTPGEF